MNSKDDCGFGRCVSDAAKRLLGAVGHADVADLLVKYKHGAELECHSTCSLSILGAQCTNAGVVSVRAACQVLNSFRICRSRRLQRAEHGIVLRS